MTRWYMYPELAEREKLLSLLREGKTVRGIADYLGCSRTAVESAIKNHGFQRPYVVKVPKEVKEELGL